MRTYISLVSLTLLASMASADTILSNAIGGDAIVGFGTNGSMPNNAAPLFSAPGWVYNNVRQDAVVGIDTSHPHMGNGSFGMVSTSGTGKGDLEYYNVDFSTLSLKSMGKLSDLSALSYDWYRDGTSTNNPIQQPSIRLMYDADGDFNTTSDRGFLVYERYYTTGTNAPVDQWVSDDVLNFQGAGTSAYMWLNNPGNPNGSTEEVFNRTLQDWATTSNPNANYPSLNAGAVIYGFNVGFGSGWSGTFSGAVDNVTIGFNGNSQNFNFETKAVPEPTSIAALGLGVAAMLRRRRKA
jgi:hypothetical protein